MFDENSFEELLAELTQRNIKHTPKDIIAIVKLRDGRIIFLETGNSLSGWQHILEKHEEDFIRRGIAVNNIIDLLMQTLETGRLLGIQGVSRSVYQVEYEGEIQYVSIDIGSNGYIVSANPTPRKSIQRLLVGNLDEQEN